MEGHAPIGGLRAVSEALCEAASLKGFQPHIFLVFEQQPQDLNTLLSVP